jgi:hypothetical protein
MFRQKAFDYLHKVAERCDLDIEWDVYEEISNTAEAVRFAVEGLGEEMRCAGCTKRELRKLIFRVSDILEGIDDDEPSEEEERERKIR